MHNMCQYQLYIVTIELIAFPLAEKIHSLLFWHLISGLVRTQWTFVILRNKLKKAVVLTLLLHDITEVLSRFE